MTGGIVVLGMASHLPARSDTVADVAEDLRLSPLQIKMFHRLFGLQHMPHDPDLTLEDMLAAALDGLIAQVPEGVARARHLLHCHTIPQVRPAQRRLDSGLPRGVEHLSLTLAHCASSVLALDLVAPMLAPGETAILLVGEKAFHRRVRLIEDTTIMSEGAVALLVGRADDQPADLAPDLASDLAHPRWRVLGTHVTQAGAYAISRGHPTENPPLVEDYVGFVAGHISAALQRFGLTPADLRLVLPHNVNMVSWAGIARQLALPLDKVFLRNVPRLGHCFGADPFLNLMDADAAGLLAPGDRALCVSVGMGMSAASALIETCASHTRPKTETCTASAAPALSLHEALT